MQMTRGVTSNERHHAHHYGSTVSGRSQRLSINTATAKTNKQKKNHILEKLREISAAREVKDRGLRALPIKQSFSVGGEGGFRGRGRGPDDSTSSSNLLLVLSQWSAPR